MITTEEIKALLKDREALALTIMGEARGEGREGIRAVGCVVRNRLARPHRFGKTWRDVCLRRRQFSCWDAIGGVDNFEATRAAAERLVSGFRPRAGSSLSLCLTLADMFITGADLIPDVTNGADHYCTTALMLTRAPSWTLPPAKKVAEIGNHVFFRVP